LEPLTVLIIESDINAIAQMRRVLAAMKLRVYAVGDEKELDAVAATLLNGETPPALIVARVALPTGSGIRMMEETAAAFPDAGRLLISHHPRSLLMSLPGFANHTAEFLQAEFTDDQFRTTVERVLPPRRAAG
jgi:DNA-binding NtrC family response regulator